MLFQSQIYASFVLVLFSFTVLKVSALNYASVNSGDGRFMLQWTYNNSMLMFKLKCKTTGWCGVGFTTTADGKGMVGYDIAVGGVNNMQSYFSDRQSDGFKEPPLDNTPDYVLTKATEDNMYTNLEFYRNATTEGDNKDVQFMKDTKVWIVFALAMGNSDILGNHGGANRMIVPQQHNLIMEAMSAAMQPSTTMMQPSTTMMQPSTTMVQPSATTPTPTTNKAGNDVGSRFVTYAILALIVCVLHF